MKIVIILLMALMAFNAEAAEQCGTKTSTPAVTTGSGQPCEVQSIDGKIDSIALASPDATDKNPVITVVSNKGERTAFTVTPNTTICGGDMKPVTFDAIKKGMAVKIKGFCAKEGEGVATLIYLVK